MDYLADTNIVLRFVHQGDAQHAQVFQAVQTLFSRGDAVLIAPQCVYKFWTVVTRPVSANGLGWTPERARTEVNALLEQFELLTETPSIFTTWLELVSTHKVSGKPAHDARLVAAMQVHDLENVLTLNVDDFKRYGINAIHPSAVTA